MIMEATRRMISKDLRLSPRLKRTLDVLENANGGFVNAFQIEAMSQNVLKVTICQLRKALLKAGSPWWIDTIYGRGYQLRPPE